MRLNRGPPGQQSGGGIAVVLACFLFASPPPPLRCGARLSAAVRAAICLCRRFNPSNAGGAPSTLNNGTGHCLFACACIGAVFYKAKKKEMRAGSSRRARMNACERQRGARSRAHRPRFFCFLPLPSGSTLIGLRKIEHRTFSTLIPCQYPLSMILYVKTSRSLGPNGSRYGQTSASVALVNPLVTSPLGKRPPLSPLLQTPIQPLAAVWLAWLVEERTRSMRSFLGSCQPCKAVVGP